MQRERWIAQPGVLEELAQEHTLTVFTGRLRWEANLTLERFAPGLFQQVVGVDDVANPKPAPDGILLLKLDHPALHHPLHRRFCGRCAVRLAARRVRSSASRPQKTRAMKNSNKSS